MKILPTVRGSSNTMAIKIHELNIDDAHSKNEQAKPTNWRNFKGMHKPTRSKWTMEIQRKKQKGQI